MNRPSATVVAGLGRMGLGISQALALAGCNVSVVDLKEREQDESAQALALARRQVDESWALLVSIGFLDGPTGTRMNERIRFCSAAETDTALEQADLVFEAVPELLDVKGRVLDRISRHARKRVPIASTTSAIHVDELASFVRSPERFLNGHWLNPAFLMPLVELSPGVETSESTLRQVEAFLADIGKVPIRCAAAPGYIVPRIQALAMNEAVRLVEEGVATPEQIDAACRAGFGIRFAVMGLLEFIDWGGADTLQHASDYLAAALDGDRFASPRILRERIARGELGVKTRSGFTALADRDVVQYERETLRRLVSLLDHLELLPARADGSHRTAEVQVRT